MMYQNPPTDTAPPSSFWGLCNGSPIAAIAIVIVRIGWNVGLQVIAGRAVNGIPDGGPGVEHAKDNLNTHIERRGAEDGGMEN